jgi:hypothetical protein
MNHRFDSSPTTRGKSRLQIAAILSLGTALLWTALSAASHVELAGRWRLNRDLSDFPQEVGFGLATSNGQASTAARPTGGGGRGGGRGRGGGSSGGAPSGGRLDLKAVRESQEDAMKIKELIAEAKAPSPTLTIVQSEAAVAMTDASGRVRTFHPNGKEEIQQFDAGPIGAVSRWIGNQLEIRLTVEDDRRFRYTYSRAPNGQLVVQTRLEEGRANKADDVIKRVYDLE